MLDQTRTIRWLGAIVLAVWGGVGCAPPAQIEPDDVPWSYEGATGPEEWGSLSPEFALCGTGVMQSPVNLTGAITAPLPGPTFRYQAAPLEIVNLGHTLQINYAPGSQLVLGDESYELLQYHFHTPGEHLLDGREFPMALHLVHRNASGQLAVVGVLIETGAENAALRSAWGRLPTSEGQTYRDPGIRISAQDLLPSDQSNYRYAGSLTTPPCTEGVRWIVMAEPIEMSAAQIQALNAIIHTSNRPVQPLGARHLILDAAR